MSAAPASPAGSEPGPRWTVRTAAAFLLALWTVLVVLAAARLGQTSDEGNYVNAGRVILREKGWNHVFFTNAQGPVALYAGQLLLGGHELDDVSREELTRARLGVLPFGLLLAALVYGWSRRVHGERGALVSLGLFTLSPLTIGYASLLTVDVALSAFVALLCWLAWEHLRYPCAKSLVGLGVALGLACGTKYVALLYAPVVALFAAVAAVRPAGSVARRTLRAALAVLVVGATTLVTLHACYGFLPGLSSVDPALYVSEKVRALVSNPATRPLVRLLPQAYTDGIDYQVDWSEGGHSAYLNGRYAAGHASYYLWAALLKTPEVLLALGLAWAALRLPRLVRQRAGDEADASAGGERLALLVVLPVVLVPLAYFSLLTAAQVGIRYVLPAYPLAFVLLGGLVRVPAVRSMRSGPRAGLACGVAALLAFDCLLYWPNLPAYYNRLFGGQAAAYRHFVDSNSDWDQLRADGPERLRARGETGFEVVTSGHGPRFGRVALYLTDLAARDPEDPTRSRHWLDPFRPVLHLDAAWWVFDVTRADFAHAAAEDERVARDYAVALLATGDPADEAAAEEVLDALSPERAASVRGVLELAGRHRVEPDHAETRRALAAAWLAHDRPDRTVALLDGPAEELDRADSELLSRAFYAAESWPEVIRVLAPRGDLAERPGALMLLADAYRRERRHDDAIALLEAHVEDVLPAAQPQVRSTLEFLLRRREGLERIRATLRGEGA